MKMRNASIEIWDENKKGPIGVDGEKSGAKHPSPHKLKFTKEIPSNNIVSEIFCIFYVGGKGWGEG